MWSHKNWANTQIINQNNALKHFEMNLSFSLKRHQSQKYLKAVLCSAPFENKFFIVIFIKIVIINTIYLIKKITKYS